MNYFKYLLDVAANFFRMWTCLSNSHDCISRSSQIWRTTLADDFLGRKENEEINGIYQFIRNRHHIRGL